MSAIKSLEDLKRIREEALAKRKVKTASGKAQITVAMGTCGIAAGARDTMKTILNFIEANDLSGIVVTQTGCLGMCEREPIVQVAIGEAATVTYGKVTSAAVEQIMKEHVLGGQAVKEYVVPV
jgi:NADP-reducing hydrogenase subunit HndB